MTLKTWFASLTGAVMLGLIAVPAQAAPVGNPDALKATAPQTSDVQQATWYGRDHYYRRYHYGYGPRFHHRHFYGYRHFYGHRYRHYRHGYW